jgi:hypothetical protein
MNLTIAQLKAIYTCTIKNWAAFGGANATITPFLPQSNSGTRKFFLKAIGVTNPGNCVTTGPEENEGINPALNGAAVIYPFSIGSYVEQAFHSAACGKVPTKKQNRFGCNETGVLTLGKVAGVLPLSGMAINPAFAKTTLGRTLYNTVRFATTAQPIPALMVPIFGSKAAKGFICLSKVAAADIADYGFLPVATCGFGS